MMNEQITAKEQALIRQARKVATMRRKNTLWKDLEPALNRLGTIVRSIEALEQEASEKSKVKRATA